MFKKPVDAKALQRLSGADKKKLRRTAKERFPQASDADIDAILPPKAEISVSKYPNRALVYGIEGGFPMLFDVDGRGSEIYPTVYALWMVPELLPSFLLKAGEVSHYVLGGADLMFPGISIPQEGLPNFKEGEPYSVRVPGNPAPIAVGATTMSTTVAIQAGLRGKALRILHYYRDFLWFACTSKKVGYHVQIARRLLIYKQNRGSVEAPYVPNAGFFEDVVFGDPTLAQPPVDDSSEIGEESTEGKEELPSDGDQLTVIAEEMSADVNTMLKISESTTEDDKNEEEKEEHVMTVEEIDALLDKCLLQALHTSVKDKDLPILGSILWSHHILPCRPSGTSLDIKKSSHKKLSKWLLFKSSAGLISAKEDKYTKEVKIGRINRSHPDYVSFRPEKKKKEPADQKDNTTTSPSNDAHAEKSLLEVIEVYKPTTHVNPVFVAVGADTSRYYSASEASDVVFSYVEKENLVKPADKSVVILDAILCDALYKGTIKKGSTYPSEIHKRDIAPTFLGRMQIHHHVTRGSDSVLRKGAIKSIQIMTERRQGNKKMTRVSGLESFLLDADSLASELQKKFACSTTTAELPGKKGYEVLVQGGVIDHLGNHLVEHYGIPKRYIEVLDKTKK